MLTIKSNVAQIESIFITIESILSTVESILTTIESVFQIESVFHNRVDFEENRVDSGDAHNTFFGLQFTILKWLAIEHAEDCGVSGTECLGV